MASTIPTPPENQEKFIVYRYIRNTKILPAPTVHGAVELRVREQAGATATLDGRLDEPAWQAAEPLTVPVMGGNTIGRIAMELRAWRAGLDLYLAARLPDWHDDAEKAMWEMGPDGRWRTLGRTRAGEVGNKDRVLFL